jgi:pyridoxamine 5'-phosphate oxidase
MNRQEIMEFINKNPVCYLATVDGKKPRVRGMMTYRADENGIIFHTGTSKDLYKQLTKNPNVEVCFSNLEKGMQIRVEGRVEESKDADLKKEIIEARPFMKPWLEKYGDKVLAVFIVKKPIATIWTMQANFEPKEYIPLFEK